MNAMTFIAQQLESRELARAKPKAAAYTQCGWLLTMGPTHHPHFQCVEPSHEQRAAADQYGWIWERVYTKEGPLP